VDFHPAGPSSLIPRNSRFYCVNDPIEKTLWERDILDYYTESYAAKIDRFIGHWSDAGGCRRNGCTIETAMRLHNRIHRAFKQLNPKIESTFSLWFLQRYQESGKGYDTTQGWPGYADHHSVVDAGILDKDVEIGLAPGPGEPRPFPATIDRDSRAAGYRTGLWTWYRGDYETRPSLHAHIQGLVGAYYGTLPDEARKLEWHNIERNVHGAANVATYYVAAGLMWDRHADPAKLLNEYLSFIFGAVNAPRIAPAYDAIERIRCTHCTEDAAPVGTGSKNARADFELADRALHSLALVRLDQDFRPRLPLMFTREEFLADLRNSLTVIRDYARVRAVDLPRIEALGKAGRAAEANTLIAAIEKQYRGWQDTLEGGQEWARLSQKLKIALK
jgi:hypothetical protein